MIIVFSYAHFPDERQNDSPKPPTADVVVLHFPTFAVKMEFYLIIHLIFRK